jgi:hypothetical protein
VGETKRRHLQLFVESKTCRVSLENFSAAIGIRRVRALARQ